MKQTCKFKKCTQVRRFDYAFVSIPNVLFISPFLVLLVSVISVVLMDGIDRQLCQQRVFLVFQTACLNALSVTKYLIKNVYKTR